jgi:hypothetical protein
MSGARGGDMHRCALARAARVARRKAASCYGAAMARMRRPQPTVWVYLVDELDGVKVWGVKHVLPPLVGRLELHHGVRCRLRARRIVCHRRWLGAATRKLSHEMAGCSGKHQSGAGCCWLLASADHGRRARCVACGACGGGRASAVLSWLVCR